MSLTLLKWSEQPMAIDIPPRWLVGANMAIPRSVLAEVGGFHLGLDRVGERMLFNGDLFLQKLIFRRGDHVCTTQKWRHDI